MIDIYPPYQKPPMWNIDPGIVAYNAARMGSPMPVGLWWMSEGSGDKIYDYSGHGNSFVLDSADMWELDGITTSDSLNYDAVVSSPTDAIKFGTGDFTAIVGIQTTDAANYNAFFSMMNAAVTIGWTLQIYGDSALRVWGNGNTNDSWSTNVADGVLHNIAFTRTGATFEAFIDGVSDGAYSVSAGDFDAADSKLYLGSFGNDAYITDATFKYVMLFNVALIPAQVQTLGADPYGLVRQPRRIWGYIAAPPVGAIMNQFQGVNLGADLFNGTLL